MWIGSSITMSVSRYTPPSAYIAQKRKRSARYAGATRHENASPASCPHILVTYASADTSSWYRASKPRRCCAVFITTFGGFAPG